MRERQPYRGPSDSRFVSIHGFLSKYPEHRIKIKDAVIRRTDTETRQVSRSERYFELLAEMGILTDFERCESNLSHLVKDQESNYLCVRSRSYRSAKFFMNFSNTERHPRQVFRGIRPMEDLQIATVTGICLFGSGVDLAVTDRGQRFSIVDIGGTEVLPSGRIAEVDIQPHLSLYEIEKVKRLSLFLNALKRSSGSRYNEAHLITPRVQYYLYLMPAYEAGLISGDTYQRWMKAVRDRELKNWSFFRRRVVVPMKLSQSPLGSIEEELVTRVERKQRFDLMEAVERLNRQGGEWERIFQVRIPGDWRELILLSYVVGFMHRSRVLAERKVIPIHAEDPAEKVTMNQVTNFQRKLKRKGFAGYPALGIYVLQNLVSKTLGEDSFLYAPQRYFRGDIRAIVKQYVPRLAPSDKGEPSPPRVAVPG